MQYIWHTWQHLARFREYAQLCAAQLVHFAFQLAAAPVYMTLALGLAGLLLARFGYFCYNCTFDARDIPLPLNAGITENIIDLRVYNAMMCVYDGPSKDRQVF